MPIDQPEQTDEARFLSTKNFAGLNPRHLFLVDGMGALLSAFLLGVVLVRWEHLFGIPTHALYLLAAFPVLFAFFDLYAYHQPVSKLGRLLTVIAIANILYCFFSFGVALYHRQEILLLGWAYILIEIALVLILAILEWIVAKSVLSM